MASDSPFVPFSGHCYTQLMFVPNSQVVDFIGHYFDSVYFGRSMIQAGQMRERWTPSTPEEQAEVLHALDEVLASAHFCNSKRYPALLRYIVEQTLRGHGDEIKERTVGIDVFGRAPDYDTNLDTIVRYTAGEVRKRLALHYHEVDAPIQISLSVRSYRPEFLRLVEAPALEVGFEPEEPVSVMSPLEHPIVRKVRRRHSLAWVIAAVSVCLLLLIGLRSWNAARTDALSRFWSPILDQKAPTIISLGGVVFSPNSHNGTQVASDPADGNPYLSFENGLAMGRVAALLNAHGGSYRVQAAAYTTMAQIREDPTVLVGAYNNHWTYRLAEPLRFHFAPHPDERIVDAQDPKRSWARDRSKPFGDSPDYALVARFRNPSTDSVVVMIAGLQRFGTDAASQFATSPDLLEDFNRQVGWNWRNKNIEVVLRVDVVNGRAGAPIVVATHLW